MIEQYLYEIIAIISILIITAIYLLIKSKSITDNHQIQDDKTTIQPIEVEIPEREEVKEEIRLEGQEEGSFGEEKTVEKETVTTPKVHTKTKKTRTVPPHGKITKQNFSEFAGVKVLIAEDNIINQKVIKGILADTGIEITMADDGQEALDILEKNQDFQLILMDIHMPRVDGFEATRTIRKNPELNHIGIIALSGDTASDDIRKMEDAGMKEHLEKPLKMDSLYDIFYMYSAKEEETQSEFIDVITTRELDGAKGLEICGGDEDFYREILIEFKNSFQDSPDTLIELIKKTKIEEADKLLLDIIGVTANIGADKLHNLAVQIKDSLQHPEDEHYTTLLEQYKRDMKELLRDIQDYL